MTAVQAVNTITDTDFLKLVAVAAVRTAIAVASEDPATVSHAARVTLASKIVNSPQNYAQLFALSCAADDAFLALTPAQVAGSYGLSVVQSRISTVYNAYL